MQCEYYQGPGFLSFEKCLAGKEPIICKSEHKQAYECAYSETHKFLQCPRYQERQRMEVRGEI